MTVYINGVERAPVIWKSTAPTVMSDDNRTVGLAWTDLDLNVLTWTSDHAKFAILLLRMRSITVGSGSYSALGVRKNGTTPSYYPLVKPYIEAAANNDRFYAFVIVGMDSDQVIEYKINVGTGWEVDTDITLLGYIE
ncbi:hypothetical protein ES703_86672 [subsurface metagenome]